MSKFKVGDRVCCYGQNWNGSFDVMNEFGDYGTVSEVSGAGMVTVRMDNDYGEGRVCTFHRRQLVRLKPRAKAREFWISQASVNWSVSMHDPELPDAIHVREVLK